MGMLTTFKNQLCSDYAARIDRLTVHSADPGETGAHVLAGPASLTWGTPSAGEVSVTATFTNFVGDATHVGLWDGTVFCDSREFEAHFGAAATLTVTLRFRPKSTPVYVEAS